MSHASPVETRDVTLGESAQAVLFKRDDLLPSILSGTKLRKLDLLLAQPRYADASRWASVGATGSGHLIAALSAARAAQKSFDAHVFWQPRSSSVDKNLPFVASYASRIAYYRNRVTLALRAPSVLLGETIDGAAVIPAGGTAPLAVVGVMLGALELVDQTRAGLVATPARVYVPIGTGGTALGLAMGFFAAALPTEVIAVAAVERVLVSRRRLRRLERDVWRLLGAPWPPVPGATATARIRVNHGQLGRGYGFVTKRSLSACDRSARVGVDLEPVYSGKAFAALCDDLDRGAKGQSLLWVTPRKNEALPHEADWLERLPQPLRRRLTPTRARRLSRRALLVTGAATATLGLLAWGRTRGYPSTTALLKELLPWEATVLAAATEALVYGVTLADAWETALAVDSFVASLPREGRREIHALLLLVEQASPLGGEILRLTELDLARRAHALEAMASREGSLGLIYRGVRDLVMSGTYQRTTLWTSLKYPGPLVDQANRPDSYATLVGHVSDLTGRRP